VWEWIVNHWFFLFVCIAVAFLIFAYAYITVDRSIGEAWERWLRRRQFRKGRKGKHKRIDLTKLVVTEKKNFENGPKLM
jgi:putative exporter of polyketide antibiotics